VVYTNLNLLNLKAFLPACALALCFSTPTFAQSHGDIQEVRGNGKIVNKTFSAVGTKVYLANKQQIDLVMGGKTLLGKPLLTVQASDEGRERMLPAK